MDFVFLIRKMIEREQSLRFLACAETKTDGVKLAKQLLPDVVLMDLSLSKSEMDGIAAAKEIKLAIHTKVLLLTSFEQPEIIINASKKAFASGYVFKSQCHMLPGIICDTAASRTPQEQFIKELILQDLSTAERNILNMILRGQAISQSSVKTVANQKTNIFKKLGLKNTAELIHIFGNW